LAEWLYEAGIGEERAALVEDGEIVEAHIELPDPLRLGTVAAGRLVSILVPGRRGIVATRAGEVLVEPLPAALTEGQAVRVAIVREAVPEPGRPKLPRGKVTEEPEGPGPVLPARLGLRSGDGRPGPDRLEEAGWSEMLEEAASGELGFPGGSLRMSLTPAMTLFDVDGGLPPVELAVAGAAAAAKAIRRFGIGGSIGIDLPTLAGRSERQAAAAQIDRLLPQPFERTAVNGFGFLQIVRRRERPSLPEILQSDPVGAAARALLRRAERTPGPGLRLLTAAPQVIDRIAAEPAWLATLERRIGAAAVLRRDARLAISAGHVHASPDP
jgi:ribonuclease G